MFWWWGPHGGWVFGLIGALFWIAVIVAAAMLLRDEMPRLRHHEHDSPALRVLEERYARGEISREEFFERRGVLLRPPTPPPPGHPPPPTGPPPPPEPPPPPGSPPPPAPSQPVRPSSDDEATITREPPGPSAPPGAAAPGWPEPPGSEGGAGSEPTQQLPKAPPD